MVSYLVVSREGIPGKQKASGSHQRWRRESRYTCPRRFHKSRLLTRLSVPHALWTGILMSPTLRAIPQPSDAAYSGK